MLSPVLGCKACHLVTGINEAGMSQQKVEGRERLLAKAAGDVALTWDNPICI